MVSPGLSLEGLCTNAQCKAFLRDVIVNKRMGVFDLIYDDDTNKCPMCKEHVKCDTCAFNNCEYSYTGVILEDGEIPKKVTSTNFI